jgi:CBS domain-containing protein
MRDLVARDVMNPEVIKVRDDMSVSELAQFLIDSEISGAPVEDAEGRLVGVVSLTDVAAAAADRQQAVAERRRPEYYLRGWEEKWNPEEFSGMHVEESELSVGSIMTPAVFAVDEEMPISKVAEKMVHSHIHRLLVTHNHRVVGIITTSDLLGLLIETGDD